MKALHAGIRSCGAQAGIHHSVARVNLSGPAFSGDGDVGYDADLPVAYMGSCVTSRARDST
jgi:hypothetical protein